MCLKLSSDIVCRRGLKMSDLTTFKIGGVADVVFEPRNADEVSELVKHFQKEGTRCFVLGKGSNVLMPDGEIRTPIVLIGNRMSEQVVDDCEVVVGAGMPLSSLVHLVLEHSLTGLEFANCIPGTVGGAVYMNAGAFNGEMKDVVSWVELVDGEGNVFVEKPNSDFFGHRYSKVQENDWIITKVCVGLQKGNRDEIAARMSEISEKRSAKQPLDYPSAGSVFKRPKDNYASKLIDEAGLKGHQIGGAMVSTKHGGFIINVGGATASDVRRLMDYVADVVEQKNGIRLEPEIVIAEI